jgi:hypothetical protein
MSYSRRNGPIACAPGVAGAFDSLLSIEKVIGFAA